jgi:signal peptide peptidase SppA
VTSGDAVASDTIWRAVEVAKRQKPVIASFGDVAASGGYYAAAGADAIITNPYTITGSIGVIAGWPVIERLLAKVDVTTDSVEFLQNAAWHHMELGLPESEMEKLRSHIDSTYDQFKQVVGMGRKMDLDEVERIARGQIYTGAQALKLGLADSIGSLNYALSLAGKLSLDKAVVEIGDLTKFRQFLGEEFRIQFDDIVSGGEKITAATKDQFATSPHYKDTRQPTPEEVQGIVKRVQVAIRPETHLVIIPHVNLANEALGVAISSAFQSDDERSPIPIDLPLPSPNGDDDDDSEPGKQTRVVVGALLGIARSNNIPIWQFPMFCYWYAAQAAGKIGQGMGGGFLDSWFGKLMMGNQSVFNDTAGYAKSISGGKTETFAGGKTGAWDIRMEMPPLKIFY